MVGLLSASGKRPLLLAPPHHVFLQQTSGFLSHTNPASENQN